ncbi:MAG: DUF1592 domain-containing protein [Acidobacteria bacterium]|nr:DUF1592 domain-containing protein [Acidobacteriota bacterium]
MIGGNALLFSDRIKTKFAAKYLMFERVKRIRRGLVLVLATGSIAVASAAGPTPAPTPNPVLKQYCFQCHGKAAMGGLNLEQISSHTSVEEHFQHWDKVAAAIEQKQMPPAKMPQPSDAQRLEAVKWIRTRLNEAALKNAGDPGKVTVRRLTSGEYAYTIRDLTGLDIRTDRDFASDSVGGEGFTNFGDVQFMQDANLERYLESAKRVASHTVIGSGPLRFHADPGKSGFELAAISRIQQIYTSNGFRSASGEGGKAYGLDRYGKAIYSLWRYQHRRKLGEPALTIAKSAQKEGVSPRFAQHLWDVFHEANPTYPASEAIAVWKAMPEEESKARAAASSLQNWIVDWPRMLLGAGAPAAGGQGDERNFVLNEDSLKAKVEHRFRYPIRSGKNGIATLYASVKNMNPAAIDQPYVIWKNATIRFRGANRAVTASQPLRTALTDECIAALKFGKLPDGKEIDPLDFALSVDQMATIEIKLPGTAEGAEVSIDAAIGPAEHGDAVLRALVNSSNKAFSGVPFSVLLGQPKGAGFATWKENVLSFGSKLPASSHGEPTPADKDPIPAPYNNVYNQPERDSFHINVKYYRQDRFIYEHVLDDKLKAELDYAWNDLLSSFGYHDAFLKFVLEKYKLPVTKRIHEWSAAEIEALPAEPKQYVKALRAEYDAVQKAQATAQPRHINDCLQIAAKAWRRELTPVEKDRLRGFYAQAREIQKLDHDGAIRATVARILVSPAFLYRLETQAPMPGAKALSQTELASRLSYFLWSSTPDEELSRAARLGELTTNAQIEKQVRRMVADPKARRFATEFFGQWLGFYRFDQYAGVDTGRYPEFNDELKSAMYDEAVSFFEHIVRKDRPIREMFTADYTFLNQTLAKHYGVKKEIKALREAERVEGANEFGRGGMLRLGAVLTATSAPLRTSPVKRGDWVLRRILGTPTPPPPANAGTIPADDKNFGGMSLKERLAAHQRNASCAGCHSRIDALGFPLEGYDAVGRLRTTYNDGKPIDASSVTYDKVAINGVEGLTDYLKKNEQLVLRNFSRKLLGYALGRTMSIGDQPLIDQLSKAGSETNVSSLLTQIVTSKQFHNRRAGEETIQTKAAEANPKTGGL